jgi:hypothetical protein
VTIGHRSEEEEVKMCRGDDEPYIRASHAAPGTNPAVNDTTMEFG